MRVAYLVNQYPKVSHSFIRREILALEAMGVAVLRIASRGWSDTIVDEADHEERRKTQYLLRDGLGPLLAASARAMLASPGRFLRAAQLAVRMARMSPRPAPVHLAYLAQACLMRELLLREGVAHVHAHFGTNPAEVAMLCAELGGPPFSFTVHGPEEFDAPAGLHLSEKIERAAFVAAVSSFGRSQLFRWVPHAQWPKVKVVRCGIEQRFAEPGPVVSNDSRMLVCVGRLCEQKGQALLLAAARDMAARGLDFELVLAGDGEMRGELQDLIDAYGLGDRVRITGWVSGDEVRSLLLQSRGLVLASFAEGLPVVIMEAMALARPVISTLIAGIPELVRPGQEGWLVPAGDCSALARACTELLLADPRRLEKMGLSARERVLQRHSADGGARKLAQHFGVLP
ncbi:glycosyltransferase [Ramlibacter ginsenosidimutans]|uniref:Glycosyltransferase n=1 Tax=Ramlibacter ginsenosidimutans TaxID=502333 RepID=A0A934TPN5_9BURK|nr:glycosyltransferase [Ramlibacter ginsenosidimutans]MBK6005159.1 glycosyltransferase [Ramlibacter ginsenosidimutans]